MAAEIGAPRRVQFLFSGRARLARYLVIAGFGEVSCVVVPYLTMINIFPSIY